MEYPITSRDNEKVKQLCRLMESPSLRAQTGLFVVESLKLCTDIAAVLPPRELYYTARALERTPALAGYACERYLVGEPVAAKLARTPSPQGVWAVFERPCSAPLAGRRLLALDAVQDPGNVGAVLRSAAAFGYNGVLLGPGCADPYGMKALRAGMSSTVKLPIAFSTDLAASLLALRREGYLCLAARLEESEELPALPQGAACVLVVGSEGQGIAPAVAAACDKSVRIPIAPAMESLNAAVAAAVLMWHYRA